jgi:hypothetical protein
VQVVEQIALNDYPTTLTRIQFELLRQQPYNAITKQLRNRRKQGCREASPESAGQILDDVGGAVGPPGSHEGELR